MDKMPTNSSESPSPSDTNNDNNASKLNFLAEQQQQPTNQVGPRPDFCDDVLLDVLHFLRRTEHAQVRLANRRMQWLSDTACARYSPRVVPWLWATGVYADPFAYAFAYAKRARPNIVANSMRVYSSSGGGSSLADIPAVEPPEDIVRLSVLDINDFIGPELLQFLRVSARLMGKCCIVFTDFDNFVRHHSTDFIVRFLDLFRSNRSVRLHRLSSLATPLFIDHPTLFNCIKLTVECLDTFPLDAFQHWLHLDERQQQQQQKERHLVIRFRYELQMDQSIHSAGHFVHQLKKRFLDATSCCSFIMEIQLFDIEGLPFPPVLQPPFVVDNERTGELLEFRRDHHRFYRMERRRRRESTAGQEDTEKETTTQGTDRKSGVYIGQVVQGDKQRLEHSEDKGE